EGVAEPLDPGRVEVLQHEVVVTSATGQRDALAEARGGADADGLQRLQHGRFMGRDVDASLWLLQLTDEPLEGQYERLAFPDEASLALQRVDIRADLVMREAVEVDPDRADG